MPAIDQPSGQATFYELQMWFRKVSLIIRHTQKYTPFMMILCVEKMNRN
jgi:hypothetical protein